MPRLKEAEARLSVSLSDRDRKRLLKAAAEMDVSLAWVARRAISQWIDAYERDPEHMLIRAYKPIFFEEPDK